MRASAGALFVMSCRGVAVKRVAVFVDVGYLYAGGSVVLAGSPINRERMNLRQAATIAKLVDTTRELTDGGTLLRVYWYDGLVRGRPSQEQQSLAHADNVKLRLGVVTAGRQKGVDSMIVTDLIELARNHAISDAVLLSGDEDLRIGVQIAQSFGVRVHLIGIEPSRGNQSNLLMQEADTTIEWSKGDIEEILSLKLGVDAEQRASSGQAFPGSGGGLEVEALGEVVANVISSIAVSDAGTVKATLAQNPAWIPPEYDRMLLLDGAQRLGRELTQEEKRLVRTNFRDAIKDSV